MTVTYSVMDILLVFVVFRAIVFGLELRPYQGIIAAALLDLFAGDFTYGILVVHGNYRTGSPADAWYLLAFVLMARGRPASVGRPTRAHRAQTGTERLPPRHWPGNADSPSSPSPGSSRPASWSSRAP